MVSVLALLGFTSLATSVGAAPSPANENVASLKDSFVLDVHRRSPHSPESHLASRSSHLDYEGYWYANVTVGGQEVTASLDTGSADFWLFSPRSNRHNETGGYPTWNPRMAKKTSQIEGYNFSIGYGVGGNQVNGSVYRSNVCIGDACTDMAVGSVTASENFDGDRSGILGLAFSGGNSVTPKQQLTFMESLAPSLKEPIFAMNLHADDSSASQIAFGSNPFSFAPPLEGVVVDTSANAPYPYSWSYTDISYYANDTFLGVFDVVFDTGGPMMSASEDIVRGYYSKIPEAYDVNGDATAWTVPCGTELPDMRLDFDNGAEIVIPGFRFYNGNYAKTGACQVWLVKENTKTRAVIGDPFFEEHLVIFNQDTGEIQWAPKFKVTYEEFSSSLLRLIKQLGKGAKTFLGVPTEQR